MHSLSSNRIHYKFFDKTFQGSSYIYLPKDSATAEEIERNRTLVMQEMKTDKLAILKQVHGNKVHFATQNITPSQAPEADASVTNIPGIILGILTADCVPVLFYCPDSLVIGAAHCGWKSAKGDIINNVVFEMQKLGARNIEAIIGPAIQQKSYEVSQEYYDNFYAEDKDNSRFFMPSSKPDHFLFNLPAYVKTKLEKAGISKIDLHEDDTYSMPEKYHSYRRHCHGKDQYKGNLLSGIMIV